MRILIVDDERLLVKGLRYSLEQEGYETAVAYDGAEALAFVQEHPVDLVILDLMLPKIDGYEVCRQIRQEQNTPIIMLTARGDDVDKIVGLELGADDYLAKPFNTRELIARIRAVMRRTGAAGTSRTAGDRIITAGDLEINLSCRTVKTGGKNVDLTGREFDLLVALTRRPGRVLTREILLEQVWGSGYFGEIRVVDVYIRRLREKLEPDPLHPRLLLTKWGVGYYFEG